MKAIMIPTNGPMKVIECEPSYEFLSSKVGGYIQCIDLGNEGTLWMNEEGKLLGLPTNHMATALYAAFIGPYDIIVGDAIMFGPIDDEGNNTSVSDEFLEMIKDHITV